MANLSVPRPPRDQPSDMSSVLSFTTAFGHAIIGGAALFAFISAHVSSHLVASLRHVVPESRAVHAMVRHSAAELQNWPHGCKGWLSWFFTKRGPPGS